MSYRVEYAVTCFAGKVRTGNEDNFYIDGNMLPEINDGLPQTLSGSFLSGDKAMAAVFDGLGGCRAGEKAAYLAAETMHKQACGFLRKKWFPFFSGRGKSNSTAQTIKPGMTSDTLIDVLCRTMNQAVCAQSYSRYTVAMGTTVVAAIFRDKEIVAWNVGDSMSFLVRDENITSISKQHVTEGGFAFGKPAITQCLGIPPEEMVLEPFVQKIPAQNGDMILLTSDGITDALSEKEILELIRRSHSLKDCVESVSDVVNLRGAPDNATAILCRILH